ncbi:PREDICTED: non-functional pseudokinase ZED1 [Tarenaya hassleriana]|uniref:non-functional pseudokinase ZED1 n=1 Tax=Tarenaya hassleriana TaxID=28532 RepID=UPI00053C1392|nr:PREDICTED: non-functional pseudokinase ZED1 [Tarenaya hassleriana]
MNRWTSLSTKHCWEIKRWRKKEKQKRKKLFLQTGSTFLQQLVADCDGKSNPIRMFSSAQILEATDQFDPSCRVSRHGYFTWYRGTIDDRVYALKRFYEDVRHIEMQVYTDIAISTRVSNHPNFLKLLGCCLEFPLPVLVYEYADNGVLDEKGGVDGGQLLPWKARVKVAKEIANAVTYLHMAFPRIIVHRDINPMNVFLDKNWTAKLTGFSCSVSLPEGKSEIEDDDVWGMLGYLDPLQISTGIVTEYTDVYGFGTFLKVLLTGRPAILRGSRQHIHDYVRDLPEDGELAEIIDQETAQNMTAAQRSEMAAFRKLALSCCEKRSKDRPKMIEVAKELKQIEKTTIDSTSSSLSELTHL